jgi:hypothetical protein
MSDISTIKGLSLDPFLNIELKKKYERHLHKINEIGKQKTQVKEIATEQKRISKVVKKYKDIARQFRVKEDVYHR